MTVSERPLMPRPPEVLVVAELGAVTRALRGIVQDWTGDEDLARRICQACVDGLDVDGAAISILTGTTARTSLWATDATAELLEDLQFTLNEGACMQAAHTRKPVLVADLHHSSETARWPAFAAAVAEQTLVGALFALPLQWGAVNLGVLDLYRAEPGALSPAQRQDALAAADAAAVLLIGQRTDPLDPVEVTDGCTGGDAGSNIFPPGHRAEVHQATGMVLAQLGISAVDALARLRAYAFVHQRLLRDVAHDVVTLRLAFSPDTDPAISIDTREELQ